MTSEPNIVIFHQFLPMNLFCDQVNCPAQAFFFCFLRNGEKSKVCKEHLSVFMQKKVKMFEIEDFLVVETEKEASEYKNRRKFVRKGLKNVTKVQKMCEEEWRIGQNRLQKSSEEMFEVFQKAYAETWLRLKQRYDQTMYSLTSTRTQLLQLLRDPHLPCPSLDLLESPSPFRLILGDCRLPIVQTLLSHFHILPQGNHLHKKDSMESLAKQEMKLGRVDIADEINQYVKEHGLNPIDFSHAASRYKEKIPRELTFLLPNAASEQEISEITSVSLETGQMHIRKGEYKSGISEFQLCRTLLDHRNMRDSELWLRFSNTVAESYHQVQNYAECIRVCREVLQTWRQHEYTAELWSAVFYMTDAMRCEERWSGRYDEAQEWMERLQTDEECRGVTKCVEATVMYWKKEQELAAKKYEEGLSAGLTEGYVTAVSRGNLGFLYDYLGKSSQAEEQYLQCHRTLSDLCPMSLSLCTCLKNQGFLYRWMQRYEAATKTLLRALSVLSDWYPSSLTYGLCMYNLGLVYEAEGRRKEAAERLHVALGVLEKNASLAVEDCKEALKRLRSK